MKKVISFLLMAVLALLILTRVKMNVNNPDFLDVHLLKIESYIEMGESIDPEVSKVNVAWHLYHSLLTIKQIYIALEKSDPDQFNSSVSVLRTLSLTGNYIPRGRAQSPTSVRPPDDLTKQDVQDLLEITKNLASQFKSLDEGSYFDHPYFGHLDRSHAMRFLQVHTNHHLKIVKDILQQ